MQRQRQKGVTMLVVLVLLSVMLLGALAMARLAEVSTLAGGNAAWHDAAVQASEVGLNNAFQALRELPDESQPRGTWYSPIVVGKDGDGIPSGIDWTTVPSITVGALTVRYVAERVCSVAVVTDPLRDCLVRHSPQQDTHSEDKEKLAPPNARQFRITVRVTGPKGTESYVQSLVTRGS